MLVIKVRLFKSFFTNITIDSDSFYLSEESHYTSIGVPVRESSEFVITPYKTKQLKLDAYFLQLFVKECLISAVYRKNVLNHILKLCDTYNKGVVFLKFIFEPPQQEIIDVLWNEKLLKLIWMRVDIENAFSWLSTLGGAYSALGDYFENCADEAGRISLRQYKLSKMLGDEGLAARSKLYLALAYSQKGRLKVSRQMVRQIAEYGRETKDTRLVRMCHGVWAKLRYLRELENLTKCKVKNNSIGDGKNTLLTVM